METQPKREIQLHTSMMHVVSLPPACASRYALEVMTEHQIGAKDQHSGQETADTRKHRAPERQEDGEAAVENDARKGDDKEVEDRLAIVRQLKHFPAKSIGDGLRGKGDKSTLR